MTARILLFQERFKLRTSAAKALFPDKSQEGANPFTFDSSSDASTKEQQSYGASYEPGTSVGEKKKADTMEFKDSEEEESVKAREAGYDVTEGSLKAFEKVLKEERALFMKMGMTVGGRAAVSDADDQVSHAFAFVQNIWESQGLFFLA